MQVAPSYEQLVPDASAALVQASPAGTVARVAAHSAGFGLTVGGVLGHVGLFVYVMGIAQRAPEHTRTMLQSGLKSLPYSQSSPSFEHAFWSPGSVSGHAGLFVLVPPPPPSVVLVPPDVVFPEQALAASPAPPSRRRANAGRIRERGWVSMACSRASHTLRRHVQKTAFLASCEESGWTAV